MNNTLSNFTRIPAAAWLLLLAGALGAGTAGAAPKADLAFRGTIRTADPAHPEARALAVAGGSILYVGDEAGLAPWLDKKTRVIDLGSRILMPGFVDGGARLMAIGRVTDGVDLQGAGNFDDMVRRLAPRARATLPGRWLFGSGWDAELWNPPGQVRMTEIQGATGNRPACLFHATDDAIIVNGAALAAAEIPPDLPDPPGGRFERNTSGGAWTGVLMGEAARLVTRAMPAPTSADLERWYGAGLDSCLARGITLVHDIEGGSDRIDALRAASAKRGDRPMPLVSVTFDPDPVEALTLAARRVDERGKSKGGAVEVSGLRLTIDGGLATRGALLARPYADNKVLSGEATWSRDALAKALSTAASSGWRPVIETHGDAALAMAIAVVDSLEQADGELFPTDRRPRFLGLDLSTARDREALATAHAGGIVIPGRIVTGWRWVENRLGTDYPADPFSFASLGHAGVSLALATDAPAPNSTPLIAYAAAVTRQDPTGRPGAGWYAQERLTRDEAFTAVTRGGAELLGRAGETGSLVVGKRADLVVLSGDLLTVPDRELWRLRVDMTVVGGRIAFDAIAAPGN